MSFAARAFDLYATAWPRVPAAIRQTREWGSDWFAVSRPFVVEEDDRLLAHVGVIACDLALAGSTGPVAALHAVCVHPEHRGRGLGRRAIEEALAWIDAAGFATTILWSEKVDLYRRFGFAAVPESIFIGPAPPPVPVAHHRLDLAQEADRALLAQRLRTRRPVSRHAAAADDGWHLLIDLALWPEARGFLVDLPDHDALLVAESDASTLRLYDVLAADALPPVAAIVGAVAGTDARPERLEVHFTPDRLDLDLEPAPHPSEDVLMVRGAVPAAFASPFALSPLTRT